MTINFVCSVVPNIPMGGMKIIYDYANALALNNNVYITYVAYLPSVDHSLSRFIKSILKYIYVKLIRQYKGCKWFQLSNNVKEIFVWRKIPMFDDDNCKYIATVSSTAFLVNDLEEDTQNLFYFIQGYETFVMSESKLLETYNHKMNKIVISEWLRDIIFAQTGKEPIIVPNGFDSQQFNLYIPYEKKNKYKISVLYHINKKKGFEIAMNALLIAKSKEPNIEVELFGVYEKPNNLPVWIHYYKNPTVEEHLRINNECAIYLGTSEEEGWGLTIGEAMMCGQAIVCTDNKGYLEMATDNFNALVSPVGDYRKLANDILLLINDNYLRYKISSNGFKSIQRFKKENSIKQFEKAILN